MASKTIKIETLLAILALVLFSEWLAWQTTKHINTSPLLVMGIFRCLQIIVICVLITVWEGGLASIGWAPVDWTAGIRKGALWVMGFGMAAGAAMLILLLLKQAPLRWIQSPMPNHPVELLLFFLVGGLIAPVAEELCFRGVIYTFFRRWGVAAALITSTVVFVALHSVNDWPITQIVGGIVFAIAYETSKNLMVPITIHVAGNLAIFGLSLLQVS